MKCSTVVLALLSVCVACGPSRKLTDIKDRGLAASIQLPAGRDYVPTLDSSLMAAPVRDTITVTDMDGNEVLIMRAIRDEETGDMVATEQLNAAMVTARFRNVAERHGKVDLEFQIIVPSNLHDSRWQLRFHPDMFILRDSIRLDDVLITGSGYRKAQLRGYEQYWRFIGRIITDSTRLVDVRNLELFVKRNIPALYAMRNDSTEVSDESFESCFGVNGKMALEHYTRHYLVHRNERISAGSDKAWERYVKSPLVTEGVRLDTVITALNGDIVYNYIQTINTRPGLRKVDVVLEGEIFEQDRRLYTIPRSEPLTFYVSSVSAFVDGRERYLTKVISRSVQADASCVIDFKTGRSDIDESLGDNRDEIMFIKDNIRNLLTNDTFELDSVTIVASASPEGTVKANNKLSFERARSASRFFENYARQVRDSVRNARGLFITVGEDMSESGMNSAGVRDIGFISRSGGENWTLLDELVECDTLMSRLQIAGYEALKNVADMDERERKLRKCDCYDYVYHKLYPRLRTVRFNFALHRKGMVKDTVHTSVLDTAYMRGVQMIRDHDYQAALDILTAYQDFNTAVAYVALDRNLSAMNILKDLPKTAQVNYMLALLYSRTGDEKNAVECYIRSCRQDGSFVFRGNLDPEVAALIKKYNLNTNDDYE